jgi:hypothetical protein
VLLLSISVDGPMFRGLLLVVVWPIVMQGMQFWAGAAAMIVAAAIATIVLTLLG